MRRVHVAFAVLASLSVSGMSMASPPPPPPEFIDGLVDRIVPAHGAVDPDRYAGALAGDVTVSVNGTLVARGKDAWLAIERATRGPIDWTVIGFVAGRDSILVIDRYDDRSDVPTSAHVIADPRYRIRAARYAVGADHLVHALAIVETEGVLQTAR